MREADDLNRTLDLLLSKSGRGERIDPFRIARRMGFSVTRSSRIEGSNALVSYINGRWKITLNRFDPIEVQHLLLAHEMFEILLPESPGKEELCRMGASLLLIPRGHFEASCIQLNFDPVRLKERFPFLSYKAIALRSLALQQMAVDKSRPCWKNIRRQG